MPRNYPDTMKYAYSRGKTIQEGNASDCLASFDSITSLFPFQTLRPTSMLAPGQDVIASE